MEATPRSRSAVIRVAGTARARDRGRRSRAGSACRPTRRWGCARRPLRWSDAAPRRPRANRRRRGRALPSSASPERPGRAAVAGHHAGSVPTDAGAGPRARRGGVRGAGPVVRRAPVDEHPDARSAPRDAAAAAGAVNETAGGSSTPVDKNVKFDANFSFVYICLPPNPSTMVVDIPPAAGGRREQEGPRTSEDPEGGVRE